MSGNFQLEVDPESVYSFAQDFLELSNDINIEISSLSENSQDQQTIASLSSKLDGLQSHAITCCLYPIADAIEINANAGTQFAEEWVQAFN